MTTIKRTISPHTATISHAAAIQQAIMQGGITRKPAVAGMFYPSAPQELRQMVQEFLSAAYAHADLPVPKAIIAPHAGYVYSGPIAGSAYACLQSIAVKAKAKAEVEVEPETESKAETEANAKTETEANAKTEAETKNKKRSKIENIVILAPAHHYPFTGIAVPEVDFYATPLGKIRVNTEAVAALLALNLPFVARLEEAYAAEHAIEVHLPFLQVALGEGGDSNEGCGNCADNIAPFSIVPILVGRATVEQVAAVLQELWDGDATLIVVSSDLSHYLSYADAKASDARAAVAIVALDYAQLDAEMVCGAMPIRGLLEVARRKNLHAMQIDLRSSGDTAGGRDQVVGYGAFHLYLGISK